MQFIPLHFTDIFSRKNPVISILNVFSMSLKSNLSSEIFNMHLPFSMGTGTYRTTLARMYHIMPGT